VSVQVTRAFGELSALRSQWTELFLSRPNEPSTSFEWTAAMVRHHVGPDDRCFLVRLERDAKLVGFVPLVLRTLRVMGRPIRLLAPLSEDYNTHSDLLLSAFDDDILQAVVSTLFDLDADWDCFRMARLLETNPLVQGLCGVLKAGNISHGVREGLSAYVLDLPSSHELYLAARSSKFRNYLKRTERKLSDSGRVEVHELSQVDDFDEGFAALLRIEQASWKQSHGSSITAVRRQTGFYHDFARAALGAGSLHVQWLTLESKPIAYNLGYLTQAGYHYLKTSYDDAYRSLSPATVLRARLIESLIARGVSRFDFPGEPYQWESQWTSTLRRRVVLSVYPPTVRGQMLALIERLRPRSSAAQVQHVDPRATRPRSSEGA